MPEEIARAFEALRHAAESKYGDVVTGTPHETLWKRTWAAMEVEASSLDLTVRLARMDRANGLLSR